MRVCLLLLLALAVIGRAAGDCGPQNLLGGWAPINDDLIEQVENVTAILVARYVSTIPEALLVCSEDNLSFTVAGCQQSVALNTDRFRLEVNVTCPDAVGKEVAATLHMDAISVGVGNLEVIDVDVVAVYVDGSFVGYSLRDLLPDATGSLKDRLGRFDHDLDSTFDEKKDMFDRIDRLF